VSSEISDLLLFVSYFASQNMKIKFENYFFDVCCVNEDILVRYQIHTTSYSTRITSTVAASGPIIWTSTYGLEPVLGNRLLIEPYG